MLFSIIVPVYQVEPYLQQCIDSILNQTLPEFELILVDDGSPDRCPEICDQYAAQDPRVQVIHKENGGLVSARQAGHEAAKGTYVVNVDSDDWIAPDMLEQASVLLTKHEPDLICFGVNFVSSDDCHTATEPVKEGLYSGEAVRSQIISKILLDKNAVHMFYYVWAKVFRREKLYPCQMAVDQRISMGEDVACLTPYYLDCASVYVSHAPMYFCRCRQASMSRSFNPAYFGQLVLLLNGLHQLPAAPDSELSAQIDRYGCFSCFVLLVTAAHTGAARRLRQIKEALQDPVLQETISRAAFQNQTVKTRLALFLLRRNWIYLDYWMLWACERLKALCGR